MYVCLCTGDEAAIIKSAKREEDTKETRQRIPSHRTAEEAVEQLQASEKLIAGIKKSFTLC